MADRDRTPADFFTQKYGHGPEVASEAQKGLEWNRLLAVCDKKGFKFGWVAHQFKELFGDWPPRDGYARTAETSTAQKPASQTDEYGLPGGGTERGQCPHCGGAL